MARMFQIHDQYITKKNISLSNNVMQLLSNCSLTFYLSLQYHALFSLSRLHDLFVFSSVFCIKEHTPIDFIHKM